jgi:site-specific DNA-methyltransferase (adenine-specific)
VTLPDPYYRDERNGITLYCGDCLHVLPYLEAASVDLLLTDPKYGISQPGVSHDGPPGKGSRSFDFFENDTPHEANALALAARRLCLHAMTETASAYWWVGHYTFGPLVEAYSSEGWKTRFLVWQKACPAPAPPGSGWPSAAELCVYAFKPGRTWSHDGTNAPRSNVFVCDSYRHGIPGKVGHPTQKPFGVVVPLIEASSCRCDTVLDCFSGSGTTGVSCLRTGRRFIGIEIEERYCEIAANRLRKEAERYALIEPQNTAKQLDLFDPRKAGQFGNVSPVAEIVGRLDT